ncbi:unnamed protein product [Polarella glacialis]|uniref:Pseudouridine synthase RsuA/RluA-like domain-containing protein n=1 Tax=Polarella glacialis TaxID=89957 RepID=A0A813GLQ9_POLGL|nr:unnamed protein product [Polarella glacialis]
MGPSISHLAFCSCLSDDFGQWAGSEGWHRAGAVGRDRAVSSRAVPGSSCCQEHHSNIWGIGRQSEHARVPAAALAAVVAQACSGRPVARRRRLDTGSRQQGARRGGEQGHKHVDAIEILESLSCKDAAGNLTAEEAVRCFCGLGRSGQSLKPELLRGPAMNALLKLLIGMAGGEGQLKTGDLSRLLQGCVYLIGRCPETGALRKACALALAMRAQSASARDLAVGIWSLAKTGFADPVLLKSMAGELAGKLGDLDEVGLSMFAWALASYNSNNNNNNNNKNNTNNNNNNNNNVAGDVVAALAKRSAFLAAEGQLQPQSLASVAWALAKIGAREGNNNNNISNNNNKKIGAREASGAVGPQVSTSAKKPPSLDLRSEALPGRVSSVAAFFRVAARVAAQKAPDFAPQGIANLAWALASHAAANGTLREASEEEQRLLAAFELAASPRLRDFKPQELSNLAWAFSKLKSPSKLFFQSILKEAVCRLDDFEPQQLSNLAWALAASSVDHSPTDAKTSRQKKTSLAPGSSSLTGIATTSDTIDVISDDDDTRMRDIISKHIYPQELLLALVRKVIVKIATFTPQGLANIAWAFATLGESQPELFHVICQQSLQLLDDFKPQEMANLAWACATMDFRDAELSWALARAATQKIDLFKPQELSSLTWFFATSGVCNLAFLRAVAKSALPRLGSFSPHELSNLAWSFAKLGDWAGDAAVHDLFDGIAIASEEQMKTFSHQDCSNLVWAFATVSVKPPTSLLDVLAARSSLVIDSCSPQSLANIAWAFATLALPCDALLLRVSAASLHKLGAFKAQEMSNLAWAFATLGVEDRRLFAALSSELSKRKLSEFRPQELSNLVWSFATLGEQDDLLFSAVCKAAVFQKRLCDFAPQNLANTAWAFATVGHAAPELFAAIAEQSLRQIGAFEAKGLLSLMWAFSRVGVVHLELFKEIELALVADLGRGLDSQSPSLPRDNLRHAHLPSATLAVQGSQGQLQALHGDPRVVLDLSDRLVVEKPAGWEVDSQKSADAEDGAVPARKLSSFLQALLPPLRWPIVLDADRGRGMVHRIDVPCSGLVLCAKTYEAFYDLKMQLNSGGISRDYVVLVHGWLNQSRQEVNAPLHWTTQSWVRTCIRRAGKPSLSHLKVLAHAGRRDGKAFSLVAVRIDTGRRHQIRAHTAHIGHPVVCDGKYSCPPELESDSGWCMRNFLHRYRLGFLDAAGEQREACAPLPSDLEHALSQLLPRSCCSASAAQLTTWGRVNAEGTRPLPWTDWERLSRKRDSAETVARSS